MENDDDMDMHNDEEVMTPFRALLHRAISFLIREEEKLEQEMIDVAIENSLDSYRDSLFSVDHHTERKVKINSSVVENDMEDECHLCLDTMKKGENVFILPCQHTFHTKCVDELVVHQHIVCPLCRKSIPLEIMEEKSSTTTNGDE